jgi:hypothetical protein
MGQWVNGAMNSLTHFLISSLTLFLCGLCGLCGSTHHGGIHQSRLGDLVDNGLPSGPTKAALASAPQRMA